MIINFNVLTTKQEKSLKKKYGILVMLPKRFEKPKKDAYNWCKDLVDYVESQYPDDRLPLCVVMPISNTKLAAYLGVIVRNTSMAKMVFIDNGKLEILGFE
jgi:hypothetical protein